MCGGSSVIGVLATVQVVTAIVYRVLLSGNPKSSFHWKSVTNCAFWHPQIMSHYLDSITDSALLQYKFKFLLRFYKRICVVACKIMFYTDSVIKSALWLSKMMFPLRS